MKKAHWSAVGLLPGLLALALAADEPRPIPPLLVLCNTGDKATLSLGGDDELNVKGGILVNCPAQNAVYSFDSRLTVEDGALGLVGGYQPLGKAAVSPKPTPAEAMADPYTGVNWPQTGEPRSRKTLFVAQHQEIVLRPGIYYGGINASSAEKVTLEPGVYHIVDGDFVFGKGELTGDGVTFLVYGGRLAGKMMLNGGAKVHLTPPTEGDLAGIVIASWCSDQALAVSQEDTDAKLDGLIYAPVGMVCSMFKARMMARQVVSWTITLSIGGKLNITGPSLKVVEAAPPAAPGG
ncbi:MAG: hypothetical protein HYU66_28170 [Armatimonadetes bacterium]|nr:hypothetical protein [Armatimonadota bacterium]